MVGHARARRRSGGASHAPTPRKPRNAILRTTAMLSAPAPLADMMVAGTSHKCWHGIGHGRSVVCGKRAHARRRVNAPERVCGDRRSQICSPRGTHTAVRAARRKMAWWCLRAHNSGCQGALCAAQGVARGGARSSELALREDPGDIGAISLVERASLYVGLSFSGNRT